MGGGVGGDCKWGWNIGDWRIVWVLVVVWGEGLFGSVV